MDNITFDDKNTLLHNDKNPLVYYNPPKYTELVSTTPENTVIIADTDNIEVHGTDEMLAEMFTAWADYYAKVDNPETTKYIEHLKAHYAPLDSVLNTIRKPLGTSGLFIVQAACKRDGHPAVRTMMCHKNGAYISFPTLSEKAQRDNIQGFIASITYLRRVQINAVAGVTGEVDDDGVANAAEDDNKAQKKAPAKAKAKPAESKQKKLLIELCKSKSAEVGRDNVIELLKAFGKNDGNPTNITKDSEIKEAIDKLTKLTVEGK